MSLAPPPLQAWRDMPPVWARWFQALFARVGGSAVGGSTDVSLAELVSDLAPLASPALTGTPTAPTAAVDTNSTRLATTAFVLGQAASATPVMDGSAAAGASARYARADHVHPTDTSRAPLASPAFTGTPTAPTPVAGDNSTTIATTAFVAGGGAWHVVGGAGEPAFANSWSNNAAPGTHAPARFKRDSTGRVQLQGYVESGVAALVFTLPAGYRPGYVLEFSDASLGAHVWRIYTDGKVQLEAGAAPASMDSLSFPADQ